MESGGLDPRPKPPSILARLFGMTMVLTIFRNLPMEGSTSSGLITSSSSLKVIRIFLLFLIKLSSLEIPIMEIRLVLNTVLVLSTEFRTDRPIRTKMAGECENSSILRWQVRLLVLVPWNDLSYRVVVDINTRHGLKTTVHTAILHVHASPTINQGKDSASLVSTRIAECLMIVKNFVNVLWYQ